MDDLNPETTLAVCVTCGHTKPLTQFAPCHRPGHYPYMKYCLACQPKQRVLGNKARRLAQAMLQQRHRAEYAQLLDEGRGRFLHSKATDKQEQR